jgi:hypothetical protein
MANFDQFLKRAEAMYGKFDRWIAHNSLYKKWHSATEGKRLKKTRTDQAA